MTRSATVRVAAADARPVRGLGLAVMRALEAWPGHSDGGATVLVEPEGSESGSFLLDGDWVCRQPPGMRIPCAAENSWTLSGEPIFSLIPGPDSFTHIPCARITSPN
jgi:hypothetical protein